MFFLQSKSFSWKQLLLGSEEWSFLPETVFRSLIMFSVILISLSILGKRGVKQLSVFELVVIIGLGSAAGDPMFYKDVGLLPAIIVFIMVTSLYLLVTHVVGRNKKIEHLVEGHPVCLVEEGKFAINNFEKEPLGQDEFFAELRLKGVSHLGQVQKAIIETNGGISIFFYEDKNVCYGLPIMPDTILNQVRKISVTDQYACVFCGFTDKLQPASRHACPECKKDKWVKAASHKRIV
ncbi:MAG: YetF domain-containing protein [Chitinophagaceae bacterium]